MSKEDVLRGASAGLTLLYTYQRLVAQEVGQERANDLLAKMSQGIGQQVGQRIRAQMGGGQSGVEAALPIVTALKNAVGIDFEVTEKTADSITIKNLRCPFFDSMQAAGYNLEMAQQTCANCSMKIADAAVKQAVPDLSFTISKFRTEASDYCNEVITRSA